MNELQSLVSTYSPIVAIVTLAVATLVSEDLTCVAAGVLVADGRVPFAAAIGACLIGIVAGDILLMLAGRALGRTGLESPLARRFVSPDAVERGIRWMTRRGAVVVALSRFVPGTRLATYLAAGALGLQFWTFAFYVGLTALVWVPALVGVSAVLGAEAVEAGLLSASTWATSGLFAVAAIAAALKASIWAASWKNRRRIYGFWRRCTSWEFWPMWVVYPPLLVYIAYLMLEHRSATVFTAANPDIPAGGFIGESKFEILRALAAGNGKVARAGLVPGGTSPARRLSIAGAFMERLGLDFPVVIKPDQGQRGTGVAIVRSTAELESRLGDIAGDAIVQEYVPGLEFGVFYYRHPAESRGHIFSITEKRFPAVIGDGRSTLDDLILADDRAVCMRTLHCQVHRARLTHVPARGETVALVEIGSHCRGSLFLDGRHLITPAVEQAFDAVAQNSGFYFGRFDVRAASVEDFLERGEFRILELNGVTSESTNIYDPGHGLWSAYRVLAAQWRLAFEIGAENRRRGVAVTPLPGLWRLIREYRRQARLAPRDTRSHTADAAAGLNAQVPA
jgi:membrane protein DedA with SNARE-associated domain